MASKKRGLSEIDNMEELRVQTSQRRLQTPPNSPNPKRRRIESTSSQHSAWKQNDLAIAVRINQEEKKFMLSKLHKIPYFERKYTDYIQNVVMRNKKSKRKFISNRSPDSSSNMTSTNTDGNSLDTMCEWRPELPNAFVMKHFEQMVKYENLRQNLNKQSVTHSNEMYDENKEIPFHEILTSLNIDAKDLYLFIQCLDTFEVNFVSDDALNSFYNNYPANPGISQSLLQEWSYSKCSNLSSFAVSKGHANYQISNKPNVDFVIHFLNTFGSANCNQYYYSPDGFILNQTNMLDIHRAILIRFTHFYEYFCWSDFVVLFDTVILLMQDFSKYAEDCLKEQKTTPRIETFPYNETFLILLCYLSKAVASKRPQNMERFFKSMNIISQFIYYYIHTKAVKHVTFPWIQSVFEYYFGNENKEVNDDNNVDKNKELMRQMEKMNDFMGDNKTVRYGSEILNNENGKLSAVRIYKRLLKILWKHLDVEACKVFLLRFFEDEIFIRSLFNDTTQKKAVQFACQLYHHNLEKCRMDCCSTAGTRYDDIITKFIGLTPFKMMATLPKLPMNIPMNI